MVERSMVGFTCYMYVNSQRVSYSNTLMYVISVHCTPYIRPENSRIEAEGFMCGLCGDRG